MGARRDWRAPTVRAVVTNWLCGKGGAPGNLTRWPQENEEPSHGWSWIQVKVGSWEGTGLGGDRRGGAEGDGTQALP